MSQLQPVTVPVLTDNDLWQARYVTRSGLDVTVTCDQISHGDMRVTLSCGHHYHDACLISLELLLPPSIAACGMHAVNQVLSQPYSHTVVRQLDMMMLQLEAALHSRMQPAARPYIV